MIDPVYELVKFEVAGDHKVTFTINITDEKTLAYMEKTHPGKLQYDGGRVFTLTAVVDIAGMQDNDPTLWAHLKENRSDIVQRFVLARLKGET